MVQRIEAAIPYLLRLALCEFACYDVILAQENITLK